ncbi:PBP1 [Candida jiufengensis]|uniref:PBP1 n=1 Tax=Candida jiufengensis TaxID=497108 RepID=UPI002224D518|nr:PBP1 [Candida jiufengensis]KAI5953108.1 PBP1 [Candida jiufengensis]
MKSQQQNNRSNNNNKNGHRRSNSRHSSTNNVNTTTTTTTTANTSVTNDNSTPPPPPDLGDNRLVYLIAKSIGKQCIVTTTDGSRYQGLLVATDLSIETSPISLIIKNPQLVSKSLINEKTNLDKIPEHLIIESKDLIDFEVDLNINDTLVVPKTEFKTDSDISNNKKTFEERDFVKWEPEAGDELSKLTLEDTSGPWDQFKVNQEKFGVESTFDEHIYTTRIDKNAPDYYEKVAKANKIADEIEKQLTTDRHILEERGIQIDDSGMDEEDKYSGVDRRGDELMAALRLNSKQSQVPPPPPTTQIDSNKYATPRQRAAQYHNDPAIISSSATTKKQPESIPQKPIVPNESFRLNAQSEINSLREFSANFKIPHKMPKDLLPILSKDKLKQDEILKKQQPPPPKEEQPQQPPKPEKKVSKFKLNPNAAAFTPSIKPANLASPPRVNAQVPYQSPRPGNSRPYSNGSISSQGSTKRHHHVSPQDFFGGIQNVPTKEKQDEKLKAFRNGFNMFNTIKSKATEGSTVVYEKSFQTPPTWDSTIEEPYESLFPKPIYRSPSFIPSPMITTTAPIPYNFQMAPQPQFPQPMWFMPPPQNFNMIQNPYQTSQPPPPPQQQQQQPRRYK